MKFNEIEGKDCYVFLPKVELFEKDSFSISFTSRLSKSYYNNLRANAIVTPCDNAESVYKAFMSFITQYSTIQRFPSKFQKQYPELLL